MPDNENVLDEVKNEASEETKEKKSRAKASKDSNDTVSNEALLAIIKEQGEQITKLNELVGNQAVVSVCAAPSATPNDELSELQIKESNSEMNKKVRLKLFKDNEHYKQPLFVRVGGKAYNIERGVEVLVPKCVAEVIEQQESQNNVAVLYCEQLEKEFENSNQ